MKFIATLAVAAGLSVSAVPAAAAEFITVASTTSTESSGLFAHILPLFLDRTGIEVRVLSQGTGQALETARRGDADVVFVHARAAEEEFVAEGWGLRRHDVMYNDYVLVGPAEDPAGAGAAPDAAAAFAAIAAAEATFASRGDDSGTHVAERAIWTAAGISPDGQAWYRETGAGMGETLNTAVQLPAYVLTDRGTWLAFGNRGEFRIVTEGDPVLFNPYGAILVSPERHPHVKHEAGQSFIDWLVSAEGQAAIESHAVGGQQLFFGNAGTPPVEGAAAP